MHRRSLSRAVSKASSVCIDPVTKHCKDFDRFLKRSVKEFSARWDAPFAPNAKVRDFKMIKRIGEGSFGKVLLVKHKDSDKDVYAMKVLEKAYIVKTNQVEHTKTEIRWMDACRFEFLINMDFFIKDRVYLYLVMPYLQAGEMFTHLRSVGKFNETVSKFYAGQVILAIEYMHNLGFVYRDLKPENILIDKDGYVKIIDFGFAKRINHSFTYSLCGTPEYLAPEIIMSQGYNKSVDWWSIGVLIYEMSAGYPPFYAKDPMRIYEKIVNGKFLCPQHFSKALRDLVINVIQVDRTKRLGVLKNGSKDVKGHDWFHTVDWDALWHKKFKPPFKPKVTNADDATNFEQYEEIELRQSDREEFPDEFAEIVVKAAPP